MAKVGLTDKYAFLGLFVRSWGHWPDCTPTIPEAGATSACGRFQNLGEELTLVCDILQDQVLVRVRHLHGQ